jgi:hypothetical protein
MNVFAQIEQNLQAMIDSFRAGDNDAAQKLVAPLEALIEGAAKEPTPDATTAARISALHALCLQESEAARSRVSESLRNLRDSQRARNLYRR